MRSETGESTAQIVSRGDDLSWVEILPELQSGATLLRVPSLKRGYPDRGKGAYGAGISDTRIRKLEREGVIQHVGTDRYALVQP